MLIYLLLRLSLHVPISSQTGPRLSSSAFQSSNYFSIRDNSSHPFFLLTPADSALRSAVLEDCALCQETISSTELAAKAREGQFEGQRVQKQTHIKHTCQLAPFSLLSASGDSSAVCVLFFFFLGSVQTLQTGSLMMHATPALPARLPSLSSAGSITVGAVERYAMFFFCFLGKVCNEHI